MVILSSSRVEKHPALCKQLVLALLGCYEGRLWVPATDVLVRFWAGLGYAYDACSSSLDTDEEVDKECASAVCRTAFGEICKELPAEANKFLNQLINHVNWTASEFDQSLEEIRKADDNVQQDGHEYGYLAFGFVARGRASRCCACAPLLNPLTSASFHVPFTWPLCTCRYYRKCMVYFELTVNLLRLLEATVLDGQWWFMQELMWRTWHFEAARGRAHGL